MAKTLNLRCPGCNTYITFEKGFWGWKKAYCATCKKNFDLKDCKIQVIKCPKCHNNVQYNILDKKLQCPACKSSFENELHKAVQMEVNCPKCGVKQLFDPGQSNLVCQNCSWGFNPQKEFLAYAARKDDTNTEIRYGGGDDYIVWKHPRSNFPLSATVIPEAGMTAVIVEGEKIVGVVTGTPGRLGETALVHDVADNGTVNIGVYYVGTGKYTFGWGVGAAYVKNDSFSEKATVNMGGSVTMAIRSPEVFLEYAGYKNVEAKEMQTIDGPTMVSPYLGEYSELCKRLIRSHCITAVYSVLQKRNCRCGDLEVYKNDIAAETKLLLNKDLERYGLIAENVIVNIFKPNTERVLELPDYVERNSARWNAKAHAYLKNQRSMSADLFFSGTADVRVTDLTLLENSTEGRYWSDQKDGELIAKEIGEKISRDLGNVLSNLLQSIMSDVDIQFADLEAFYLNITNSLIAFLNRSNGFLAPIGLEVRMLSMNQEQVRKSSVLMEYEEANDYVASTEVREKVRKYAQNVRITQERDESNFRIEVANIAWNEDKIVGEIAEQRAEEKFRHDMNDFNRAAALEDAKIQRARKKIIDDAKFQQDYREMVFHGDARYDDMKTEHQFQKDTRAIEVDEEHKQMRRDSEHEQALHAKMMNDLFRKIEEADFEWQKKLDAYKRLQDNIQVQDEIDQYVAGSRAINDVTYMQENLKIRLSDEERAMLEKYDAIKEQREERRLQSDRAWEMELKRQALAEEMQLCKAENDRFQMEQDYLLKQRNQNYELNKYKWTLDYLSSLNQGEVDKYRAWADADKEKSWIQYAREDAERQYAAENEKQRRADEMRQWEEKSRREEKTADQAQALIEKMIELQNHMEEANIAGAQAMTKGQDAMEIEKKIGQLISAMNGMVDGIRKRPDTTPPAPQPVAHEPYAPQPTPQPAVPAQYAPRPSDSYSTTSPYGTPAFQQPNYDPLPQPGVAVVKRCPHCGYEVSKYAGFCPKCGVVV